MKEIYKYEVVQTTATKIYQVGNWRTFFENATYGYSKTLWLVDSKVRALVPFRELDSVIELEGGDSVKTFENLTEVIGKFAEQNLDRNGQIIAIGGGSISDLVGFAASVYLRGIAYSIVPSTLLSLIDAGIGGKNGINFKTYKNQLGTIYQPRNIYYITDLVNKLPPEEMADGFSEIIKYGLIMDKELFERLEATNLDTILSASEDFEEIINSCIIHKSNIVNKDPFEGDLRRILNFGHTVGHAIESIYGLSHGKSVALGMCFAAKMSELRSDNSLQIVDRLVSVLSHFHLPTKLEKFSAQVVFEKLIADKKRVKNEIHFVLLKEIGEAYVEKISLDEMMSYLKKAEEEKWISQ
jgi:3-dehydroquinate synthase